MKFLRIAFGRGLQMGCFAFLAGLMLMGCQTPSGPVFTELGEPGSETNGETTGPAPREAAVFVQEDLVTVVFSGPEFPPPLHEERIKADGTITLPLVGPVRAVGKTAGELQKEIHDKYVPKYYVRLTVVVQPKEQAYYVGGEVRSSGGRAYDPKITLTKAIQSAGDFTDYANKKKIRLTRGGKTTVHNWNKITKDPTLDPLILPGDRIDVPRRVWPWQ